MSQGITVDNVRYIYLRSLLTRFFSDAPKEKLHAYISEGEEADDVGWSSVDIALISTERALEYLEDWLQPAVEDGVITRGQLEECLRFLDETPVKYVWYNEPNE